jgi:hypothetical protein
VAQGANSFISALYSFSYSMGGRPELQQQLSWQIINKPTANTYVYVHINLLPLTVHFA